MILKIALDRTLLFLAKITLKSEIKGFQEERDGEKTQ